MNRSLPDGETLYAALVNKDEEFEGIFVAGVKTTGIFCRPTCTARKPKRENVEFFASARDALLQGYRPCRVCRPMEQKGTTPDWLKPLLAEINEDPLIRLKPLLGAMQGIKKRRERGFPNELPLGIMTAGGLPC